MNQNYLKKVNTYMPESIKKLLSKIIRKRLISNKVFIKYYQELEAFENMNVEEQEKIQFNKLKEMLIYSYNNVPYYEKQWKAIGFNPEGFEKVEDLKQLPILNKKIMLDNYDDLMSKENIKYYNAFSGGTTGIPVKYNLETDSIYKEQAFKYHHWSKLGYDYKKSRLMTFRAIGFIGDSFYQYNPVYNEVIVSPILLNSDNVDKYLKIIKDFKPDYIHGYPSGINTFCKLLNNLGIELNTIKGVFFISETVTGDVRENVEKTLGCQSLDFYGHTERAVFGEEDKGYYNFNKLYGYTELVESKEASVYNIVCTGFLNKKMPLIRYDTKDKAAIEDGKIRILGRFDSSDLVYGSGGESFSLKSIRFYGDVFNKVIHYQIIQEKMGEINFVVKGINLTIEDKGEIEKIITSKMYDAVKINFCYDREIIFTPRGKYRRLIQNI